MYEEVWRQRKDNFTKLLNEKDDDDDDDADWNLVLAGYGYVCENRAGGCSSFSNTKVMDALSRIHEDISNSIFMNDIDKLFNSAIDAIPELHLVQVYLASTSTGIYRPSLTRMKRRAFFVTGGIKINEYGNGNIDFAMREFIHASESYITKICDNFTLLPSEETPCLFCRNLSELSINVYPLALYARRARLTFRFAINCRVNTLGKDQPCIFEFYLHLRSGADENISFILRLILQMMDSKLKHFKTPSGKRFAEEIVAEFRAKDNTLVPFEFSTPTTISYPIDENRSEFNSTWRMVGRKEFVPTFSENNSMEIGMSTETSVSASLGISPIENEWVTNYSLDGNSCSPICHIHEKVKVLLHNMTSKLAWLSDCLVQFWAPEQIENRLCLVTFYQTFGHSHHLKELLFEFRKKCADHRYFINNGAMEEELGPPGRVFRNRALEYTHDLRLYSSKEFPLRDCAVHLGLRMYWALPVFSHNECVGVLEFTGYEKLSNSVDMCRCIRDIKQSFKEANLSFHQYSHDKVVDDDDDDDDDDDHALRDVIGMLWPSDDFDIPHVVHVELWAPSKRCDEDNCMRMVPDDFGDFMPEIEYYKMLLNDYYRENKEKGITGMVFKSESKACLCTNICEFDITEEPRAHVLHRLRLTVCFAVCLQSLSAENRPYVLKLYLDQRCKESGSFCLFLRSLLLRMKTMTDKRFKVSIDRPIGEELVIDVITFGTSSEHDSFHKYEHNDIPVRFNIVQCQQRSRVQQRTFQIADGACDELHSSRDVTGVEQNDTNCSDLNTGTGDLEGEQQCNTVYGDLNTGIGTTECEENQTSMELIPNRDAMEDQQINPIHVDSNNEVAILSKNKGNKENKRLFNITKEELEPYFGKPLAFAAENIGVSKSTIKRRLKELGIARWPHDQKYINNPSLYMASTHGDHVGTSKRQRVVDNTDDNSTLSNAALCRHPIQDDNTKEHNQNVGELAGNESITIKATFEEDTEMFELSMPPKMDQLNQEVKSIFDIEVGSFKLKYLDEDGERILLRRDKALSLCLKNMKRLGKTTIKIYVESIRK